VNKRWQVLIGVVVSIGFIALALRGLELASVARYLGEANYAWLIPGILVYFLAVWARTWRWHYLLRPVKVVSPSRLFPLVCIGYFGNNVYPARIGEILRAFGLRGMEGIPVSTSLATIIVERVFDGLVICCSYSSRCLSWVLSISHLLLCIIGFSVLFLAALLIFLDGSRPTTPSLCASFADA
jgi:uncharacterized protein (TIRG00374 family)